MPPSSHARLLLRRLRQPQLPPHIAIPLRQPPARLDQLHDIDDLLARHDGERHARDDPRPERVHLVRARELERARRPGVREEGGGDRRVVGQDGAARGGEEGGGEERRREGEEVERDEADFVEGAEEEEDGLRG